MRHRKIPKNVSCKKMINYIGWIMRESVCKSERQRERVWEIKRERVCVCVPDQDREREKPTMLMKAPICFTALHSCLLSLP